MSTTTIKVSDIAKYVPTLNWNRIGRGYFEQIPLFSEDELSRVGDSFKSRKASDLDGIPVESLPHR